MTVLAMIRHGLTDWNSAGRIQGHTDIELSPEGRRQIAAMQLPDALRDFSCVSSPLRRARQTARILGFENPQTVPELVEMCWGEWEGETVADLRLRYGAVMAALEARGLDFRPPGGESPRLVQRRLRIWFGGLVAQGRPVLAFTHKGVMRAALAMALDWDMLGRAPRRLDWSKAQLFRLYADGRLRLWRENVPMVRDGGEGL
jgi:probable phosphoglycerate mutase